MTGGKNVEPAAAMKALVELELLLDRRDRLRKPDLVLVPGVPGPTKEQIQSRSPSPWPNAWPAVNTNTTITKAPIVSLRILETLNVLVLEGRSKLDRIFAH